MFPSYQTITLTKRLMRMMKEVYTMYLKYMADGIYNDEKGINKLNIYAPLRYVGQIL